MMDAVTPNRSNCLSMADTAKLTSGLHVHAAPFVPGTAPNADVKAGPAAAASKANGSAASTKGAAAPVQTPDKSGEDKPGPAQGGSSGGSNKGSGGGSKGGKGGGKQGANAPGSASKLVASAASAAPFVPSSGTAKPGGGGGGASSSAAGAATPGQQQQQQPAQEKGKQQGKGKGKQQQQQQQKDQKQSSGKDSSSGGGSKDKDSSSVSKDAKLLAAAAKMSPTAVAFVPKTGTTGGGSGSSAAAVAAAAAAAASEAIKGGGSTQAQKAGSAAGAAAGGAGGRNLKSPSKMQGPAASGSSSGSQGPAGAANSSSSSTATQPGLAAPSPNRMGAGNSRARGGRGSSTDAGPQGAGSRGPGSGSAMPSYGGPNSGAAGAGAGSQGAAASGAAWGGMHGAGGNSAAAAGGQGPGKWGLLAQHQGSYGPMYSMGGYGGGYGHAGGYGGHHHHHHPHHMGTPAKQLLSAQFMPEGLRQQLQQSNYLTQLQYTPSAEEPALPDKIGHCHTLYPLEDLAAAESAGVSAAWGVRTTCLKGISSRDGHAYCLRVVCGKQVIPSLEMLGVVRSAVDAWSSLTNHPGLLVPLEGFVATELDGSPSLVVTTSYVPGAVTLAQAHLQPTQTASGQLVRNTPSEEVLWGYTTQLAAVLRAAHSMGLALRPATLSATKVLVTPVGRLKVCGLGVSEALASEVVPSGADELLQLQRDDVVAMGQLLLQLACAVGGLPTPSLDFAHAHYSPEFVRLLMLLLGVAEGGAFSWRAVSALLGERLLLDMDNLAIFNEQLLDALTREMENGRLFRLVSKLAFVTDRTSSDVGAAAGDTGNAYLLALFRDFVFHQGERDAGRVIDWGHIVENLNKLDAGVSEQVLLQSRDERSLLVVSYADIKRCVESAVSEIRTRGAAGSSSQAAGAGSGMMRPGGAHMYHRGGLHHMGGPR